MIEEPEEDYYEESGRSDRRAGKKITMKSQKKWIEEPEEDYYEEADEVIEEAEGNADDEYFFGKMTRKRFRTLRMSSQ